MDISCILLPTALYTVYASAVPTSLLYTSELNELQRKSLVSLFSCGLLGDDGDTLEELMHVIEAHAIAGGEYQSLMT